ncbi:hypothetical protein [Ligilactobacillus cholophilus]|uniref:hypothetical protein n=1 Tax=Ligilactobacillus cholophilus TaxID=3050131 RepID=UPI0025B0BE19|nr:hypothetical protein [Ligilactobacillus cholophilus]
MNASDALKKVLNCENLQIYCDYYSISVEQIKENPKIAVYILEHQQSLDKMIAGYNEMSSINQHICSEFQLCEHECQF